jgi:hypothetical protein
MNGASCSGIAQPLRASDMTSQPGRSAIPPASGGPVGPDSDLSSANRTQVCPVWKHFHSGLTQSSDFTDGHGMLDRIGSP